MTDKPIPLYPQPKEGESFSIEVQPCENTDKEIWREREGDYYADSIFVTKEGLIGINCGGYITIMPVRKWHQCASPSVRILTEYQKAIEEVAGVNLVEQWRAAGNENHD